MERNNLKFFLSSNRWHLLAVFLIGLIATYITLANLGVSKSYVGDDAHVGYHFPATQFDKDTHAWESYTFPGRPSVVSMPETVHTGTILLLTKIGLSPNFIDRLVYFLICFLAALGTYFLAFYFILSIRTRVTLVNHLAAVSAGLLYLLNNFTMILLSFPPTAYIYSYVLLPWILLLYLKDFHIDKSFAKKFIFVLAFLCVLFGNPANTLSIIALILLYEIFFRRENKILANKKDFAITAGMIMFFSMYIWLPLLSDRGSNPYNITAVAVQDSILMNSSLTSIGNLVRFLGHPMQINYPFNKFVIQVFDTVCNYFLLIIAVLGLIRKKINPKAIYFLTAFIIFVLLSKSIHSPFGGFNQWLYDHLPLFGMYRSSYYKFIYFSVLSLSVLLAGGIVWIDEKINSWSIAEKTILLLLPIFAILYSAQPFFQGIVARDFHKTVIPQEYYDARSFFAQDKTDFSILTLPQTPSGLTLDWGDGNYYAGGANPDPYFFGRPTWDNNWFLPENPVSTDLGFYKKMLPGTDVKYIFLRKDIPEEYKFDVDIYSHPGGQTDYRILSEQISKDKDFTLIKETKYYQIYEINKEKFTPHLSADNGAEVEFEKINSAKYDLEISNIKNTTNLYFAESYQSNWNLYLVDGSVGNVGLFGAWFQNPVFSGTHKIANDYFNSWTIDAGSICRDNSKCSQNADGSYNLHLVLEFWPQRALVSGFIVSAGSFAGCLIYLLIVFFKKRKRKKGW